MRIVIKDNIAERYEKLGEDLKKIYDYGLAEAAKDYSLFVKDGYLSGNPLKKRTGKTYDSVKFVRTKNVPLLSYTVMVGVGIRGRLNYLHRWIGTDKEFMSPSFEAWKARRSFDKVLEANFEKIAKKKGLM